MQQVAALLRLSWSFYSSALFIIRLLRVQKIPKTFTDSNKVKMAPIAALWLNLTVF
jgi:hypothetical protein